MRENGADDDGGARPFRDRIGPSGAPHECVMSVVVRRGSRRQFEETMGSGEIRVFLGIIVDNIVGPGSCV